ncbi:hypothetical protein M9H77_03518 [Catharanthus roseus]|uniref:Uncharacterized protein n=1 Tax=Catharanthus roseus TaxID=4058 RepID=A0ACC0CBM3_CATRO|nr:hypothetical protein M9H77_03518 [Catharanthus roseus]
MASLLIKKESSLQLSQLFQLKSSPIAGEREPSLPRNGKYEGKYSSRSYQLKGKTGVNRGSKSLYNKCRADFVTSELHLSQPKCLQTSLHMEESRSYDHAQADYYALCIHSSNKETKTYRDSMVDHHQPQQVFFVLNMAVNELLNLSMEVSPPPVLLCVGEVKTRISTSDFLKGAGDDEIYMIHHGNGIGS